MKKKTVVIEKQSTGVYTIVINGKVVKNPNSHPQGAATFETEEEAKNWLVSSRTKGK